MRNATARKESMVGFLFFGGIVLALVSFVATFILSVGGALSGQGEVEGEGLLVFFINNYIGIGMGLTALGAIMTVVSVVMGGIQLTRMRSGPRTVETNFRILARYALDRNTGVMLADYELEFADRPKFYVRGVTETGLVSEYEVPVEVYFACGEGMFGEAEIQGQWIGRFVPYVGAPSSI